MAVEQLGFLTDRPFSFCAFFGIPRFMPRNIAESNDGTSPDSQRAQSVILGLVCLAGSARLDPLARTEVTASGLETPVKGSRGICTLGPQDPVFQWLITIPVPSVKHASSRRSSQQ